MIKVILKENKFLNPLQDFITEFSYWQKNGIGTNLKKTNLFNLFNSSDIVPLHHTEILDVSNCFNNWIDGSNEEELFESFFEAYEREASKRGKQEKRGKTPQERKNFLLDLKETIREGRCSEPNIVEVENFGRFIAGGKTRTGLAKVIDKPIKTRIVRLSKEDIVDEKKALIVLKGNYYNKGEI